ncbi:MAG: homocysteine S-methyltransferase family protein [Pseudomonadota bacterium]
MTHAKYRHDLPQLGDTRLLTDGGIETTLIFRDGLDLPFFASFTLLRTRAGQQALRRYYTRYAKLARQQNAGLILDSATWRANPEWGALLGYGPRALAQANRNAVEMLFELRDCFEAAEPFVISGNIGPRGDGYVPDKAMTADVAADYHSAQVAVFDAAGVDMITAVTLSHAGEAAGIARACAERGIPVALAFTLEIDGRLPSGQPLGEAIEEVDGDPCGGPSYFMINCAHPDHFRAVLDPGANWPKRIRGLRANASRLSHAELDASDVLHDGDPEELARDYAALAPLLPNLRVFGGCCGTDHRHVRAIGNACLPAHVH